MNKRFLIAALFFGGVPLFGTVNEPLRWQWSTGYRSDNFHWHLQQPGESGSLYTERYRALQFWQNNLDLRVIHRDLAFGAQGGIGVFGRGPLQQAWKNLSFAADSPQFQFATHGWAAHGMGWFGYAINLTADRLYQVLVTPLIGYEGYVLRLQRRQGSPAPFTGEAAAGGSYTAYSRFSHEERASWNGWLLGIHTAFHPIQPMHFYAGYAYHLLHARLSTQAALDNSLQDQFFSFDFSDGGTFGHSGWAEWNYSLTRFWRVGIGGTISYFFSSVQDVTLEQSLPTETDLARKLKIRWTSVAGFLTLSGEF